MLDWLSKLFGRRPEALPQRRVTSPVCVSHDDKIISVDDGAGSALTLAWAELGNVAVLTTDAGPFEPDLFWILTNRDGRQSIAIPMDARGEHALLVAMQSRLAGFDNMAVVEAMSTTSSGLFQVWPAADLP
ncbi:hypothetical protein [Hyphomicrobium sp. CS1GBMeth3]|uniref:hypothetical protein n=1 Tax=Hyphomicrobium sp. CS1GBMeth3 TaxID=1892845 RepID=UPI000930D788|nr:hypothetical protein [Hyphomicrobium sp. CS1GBMeth3]